MADQVQADDEKRALEVNRQATELAWGLGINLFVRDGQIFQRGPGVEISCPKTATPQPMGGTSLTEAAPD